MKKTLEQFLIQFHFITMAECRRVVIQNGVRINDYVVKLSDLHKDCEYIKAGDQLKIGKKFYLVREDHL